METRLSSRQLLSACVVDLDDNSGHQTDTRHPRQSSQRTENRWPNEQEGRKVISDHVKPKYVSSNNNFMGSSWCDEQQARHIISDYSNKSVSRGTRKSDELRQRYATIDDASSKSASCGRSVVTSTCTNPSNCSNTQTKSRSRRLSDEQKQRHATSNKNSKSVYRGSNVHKKSVSRGTRKSDELMRRYTTTDDATSKSASCGRSVVTSTCTNPSNCSNTQTKSRSRRLSDEQKQRHATSNKKSKSVYQGSNVHHAEQENCSHNATHAGQHTYISNNTSLQQSSIQLKAQVNRLLDDFQFSSNMDDTVSKMIERTVQFEEQNRHLNKNDSTDSTIQEILFNVNINCQVMVKYSGSKRTITIIEDVVQQQYIQPVVQVPPTNIGINHVETVNGQPNGVRQWNIQSRSLASASINNYAYCPIPESEHVPLPVWHQHQESRIYDVQQGSHHSYIRRQDYLQEGEPQAHQYTNFGQGPNEWTPPPPIPKIPPTYDYYTKLPQVPQPQPFYYNSIEQPLMHKKSSSLPVSNGNQMQSHVLQQPAPYSVTMDQPTLQYCDKDTTQTVMCLRSSTANKRLSQISHQPPGYQMEASTTKCRQQPKHYASTSQSLASQPSSMDSMYNTSDAFSAPDRQALNLAVNNIIMNPSYCFPN